MKLRISVLAVCVFLLTALTAPAGATTIGFETNAHELPWTYLEGGLPSPYPLSLGVQWDSGWYYTGKSYAGYTPSSGNHFAFNENNSGQIQFPAAVNVEKLWAVGPVQMTLEGFFGTTKLFESIPTAGNSWLTLNWNGIDRLVFSATSPYYGIDDLTYSASAVPLPSSIILVSGVLPFFVPRFRQLLRRK